MARRRALREQHRSLSNPAADGTLEQIERAKTQCESWIMRAGGGTLDCVVGIVEHQNPLSSTLPEPAVIDLLADTLNDLPTILPTMRFSVTR